MKVLQYRDGSNRRDMIVRQQIIVNPNICVCYQNNDCTSYLTRHSKNQQAEFDTEIICMKTLIKTTGLHQL